MRCPAGVEGLAPVQSPCASGLFQEPLVGVFLDGWGELRGMGTGDEAGVVVCCGEIDAMGRAGVGWLGVEGLAAAAFPFEPFPLPCGHLPT